MKGGFILINGKFYRENEPVFSGNDIPRFNNGTIESFRTEDNIVMFAEANYNYLIDSLHSIDLQTPNDWTLPRFTKDVSRLLNKNHLFLAARVVIRFYPGTDGTDYLLTAEELPRGFYPVNDTGLLIDFYEDGFKSPTSHFAFEPANRFLWANARRVANALSRHNLILLTNDGWACETIGGSFGYIKDGIAIFPSRRLQGYRPPIMAVVMECARQCNMRIVEKIEISRDDLLNADELFIIDNCLGIQLVLGLGNERYYTQDTTSLALKLNELAKTVHLPGKS